MSDNSIFKQINDATNIVELVSKFVSLKKVGKGYFGLCPFHEEKTPSFSVSPEYNTCKCMGCGEGGNPINFLSKIKGISYQEAAAELAKEAGINFEVRKTNFIDPKITEVFEKTAEFYQHVLLRFEEGDQALKYLKERKISDRAIEKFKIGFAPKRKDILVQALKANEIDLEIAKNFKVIKQDEKTLEYYDALNNRIIFPIANKDNDIISFSGRALSKNAFAKYLGTENSSVYVKGDVLYNINNLRKDKPIYIVEGFFDCIAMDEAGFTNTVAQMGTALTKVHLKELKTFSDEINLLYDGDAAGQAALSKSAKILLENGFKVSAILLENPEDPTKKIDPDDFLRKYGKEKLAKFLVDNKKDVYQFFFDYYKESLDVTDNYSLESFVDNIKYIMRFASDVIIGKYETELEKLLGHKVVLKATKKEKYVKEVKRPRQEEPLKKRKDVNVHKDYLLENEPKIFVDILKSSNRNLKYQQYKNAELDHMLSPIARSYFLILGTILSSTDNFLTDDDFDFSNEKYDSITEPYGHQSLEFSAFYDKIKRELNKNRLFVKASTKQLISIFKELKPILDEVELAIKKLEFKDLTTSEGEKEYIKNEKAKNELINTYNKTKKEIQKMQKE